MYSLGIANGHITTIDEDDEENFEGSYTDLSKKTKLNGRYMENGDAKLSDSQDLSKNSRLNSRYNKNNNRGKSPGLPDHLRKKNGVTRIDEPFGSGVSDNTGRRMWVFQDVGLQTKKLCFFCISIGLHFVIKSNLI